MSLFFKHLMPKKNFLLLLLIIFLPVLAVYFLANPHPSNLFQHYVYIANSFLQGHFNIVDKPWHYGDYITYNNNIYFQYGPVPALILLPFVFFWKTGLSQTYISMVFGALNAILVFNLLGRINISGLTKKLFLTVFFAFGTVHFSAAATGTTWFFEHIIALFFLLLALLENFGKKRPVLLGLFFSLAVFSRQTVFLSLPFFLLYLKKGTSNLEFFKKSLIFFLGAFPVFLFNAYYNFARFGNIFDDGRHYMYLSYVNSSFPYTFARIKNPNFVSGMLDLRNIPLNLYTFFLMLPDVKARFPYITPSPYGMSIIITSPLFFYTLLAKRNFLTSACWLAVLLIACGDFLWFSQGWVQFGYRYLLDFIPFLIIILAQGIKDISGFKIFLLGWCIIVNAWGADYLKV